MVHCPISGFWPHLSSIIRVRQAVEGQELGPFAPVMRDSGDTVSGHIFGQSHKTGSREAIAAFVSGKGAFTASTDNGDCIVAPAVLLRERLVAPLGHVMPCQPEGSPYVAPDLQCQNVLTCRAPLLNCRLYPHKGQSHHPTNAYRALGCRVHCQPLLSGVG